VSRSGDHALVDRRRTGLANSKPMTARRCCFGMSISTSPLTRCWHGGGTSKTECLSRSSFDEPARHFRRVCAARIDYTVISNRPTAILAFIAGKLDMTFPFQVTIPLLNDVQAQAPQAICELRPTNGAATIIMNRSAPPFDNPDLRQVMALTLDRKAFVDTLTGGQGKIGAAMMPPPRGGMGHAGRYAAHAAGV
jgi:Bacterial extracellular solute-binding proteins, family 5 Middle